MEAHRLKSEGYCGFLPKLLNQKVFKIKCTQCAAFPTCTAHSLSAWTLLTCWVWLPFSRASDLGISSTSSGSKISVSGLDASMIHFSLVPKKIESREGGDWNSRSGSIFPMRNPRRMESRDPGSSAPPPQGRGGWLGMLFGQCQEVS